jgi:putative phosphoesterase
MRLAVLSDIHGNLDALNAVLDDLASAGSADHIWVLGDLAAFGPDPSECIQAVAQIPDAKVIQGNTDRYLTTGLRPAMPKPVEDKWDSMAKITRLRDQSFTWALERLSWADIEYLMKLETDLSLDAGNFGWVVGFHASPGDDEGLILPDMPDHDLLDALLDREGNLALGGHTHIAMDRTAEGWRMVNPGSIGLPFDGDPRAAYALIDFEGANCVVDLRRVEYDVEAVIAKLENEDYPALDLMARRLRDAQM